MARLRDRPTTDLLVLMVAGTICLSVLVGGATAGFLLLFRPDSDTGKIVVLISDVLNTLIGLLAGFLAGRSDASYTAMQRRIEDGNSKEPPNV